MEEEGNSNQFLFHSQALLQKRFKSRREIHKRK